MDEGLVGPVPTHLTRFKAIPPPPISSGNLNTLLENWVSMSTGRRETFDVPAWEHSLLLHFQKEFPGISRLEDDLQAASDRVTRAFNSWKTLRKALTAAVEDSVRGIAAIAAIAHNAIGTALRQENLQPLFQERARVLEQLRLALKQLKELWVQPEPIRLKVLVGNLFSALGPSREIVSNLSPEIAAFLSSWSDLVGRAQKEVVRIHAETDHAAGQLKVCLVDSVFGNRSLDSLPIAIAGLETHLVRERQQIEAIVLGFHEEVSKSMKKVPRLLKGAKNFLTNRRNFFAYVEGQLKTVAGLEAVLARFEDREIPIFALGVPQLIAFDANSRVISGATTWEEIKDLVAENNHLLVTLRAFADELYPELDPLLRAREGPPHVHGYMCAPASPYSLNKLDL